MFVQPRGQGKLEAPRPCLIHFPILTCRYPDRMAYVRQITPGTPEAVKDPLLAALYAEAVRRTGRVWKIVQLTSLAPRATRASLALYQELMHGPGPLPRRVRELLAVVVSQANACGY